MNESTTDLRIVPTPTGQDVLTEVLRDGARRMLAQAVEASLAIGDGALGFWKAMRQVWGTTREQRCWVHKTSNVLHHFRAQWPTRQIGLKRKALSRSVLSAICFPNPRAETGRWMSVPSG